MFKRKSLTFAALAVAAIGFTTSQAGASTVNTFIDQNFDASTSAPAGWDLATGTSDALIYQFGGTGTDYSTSTTNALQIQTGPDYNIAQLPTLDLTGATTATISFDWKTDKLDGTRFFYAEFSPNGGTTWNDLSNKIKFNSGSDTTATHQSYTVSSGFGTNNIFRFEGKNAGGGSMGSAYIDNVVVTSDAPSSVPEPASLALAVGGFALLGFRKRRQRVA